MSSFTVLTVAEKPLRPFRPDGEEPLAGRWQFKPVASAGAIPAELIGLARRIAAILALPSIWWQRARFRARLRADLRDNADFLDDIGIGAHEAQAEASRLFWERTVLKHQ
jgi:uncharacterized protein YjiS (DUF1127 family)